MRQLAEPVLKLILATLMLAWGGECRTHAQDDPTNYFLIEAEDFNFGRGQFTNTANIMPYLGGAYAGNTNAILGTDYNRAANSSSPLYRNDRRIPIAETADFDRKGWSVSQNYRLSTFTASEWFNYTRVFPAGKWRVYAALSHSSTESNLCRGTLNLITSAATNSSQTTRSMGTFSAFGTGAFGSNVLVQLRTNNAIAILDISGTNTFRYTVGSGEFDYLLFVRAQAPVVGVQPEDLSVTENRTVAFSVQRGSDDPATFQWKTNGVIAVGATNSTFSLTPPLSWNGLRIQCVLSNVIGITESREATLTVTPDVSAPILASLSNFGATTLRLIFDEPVTPPSGNLATLFSSTPEINFLSVAQGSAPNILECQVSGLAFGTSYTIQVKGVADRAATPNTITTPSSASFIASEFAPQIVGTPAYTGDVVRLPDGFRVTAGGTDIGGTADQFQYGWQQVTGDFDYQIRVASAQLSDSFLHAGFMARETLAANSRFAASFASSLQLGCFYESRITSGGSSSSSTSGNGFPINPPQTWLRLKRAGSNFAGYASLDGLTWVALGKSTLNGASNTLYVGVAAASGTASTNTVVEFRNFGSTTSTNEIAELPLREQLGPSSRRTGLIFSEIMYHPLPPAGVTNDLEFIEIYNAGAIFQEMTGYTIAGGIQYSFPEGYILPAGQFVVIAADPAAIRTVYGLTEVLGPWTGSLNNNGESLRLINANGATRLDLTYGTDGPWPVAPDGNGHSLVLTAPSYGEADPRAWSCSRLPGGSPGGPDLLQIVPIDSVVLNEISVRNPVPTQSFIELYNHSNVEVDLSLASLSDDASTNRFLFPAGTKINPRGYLAITQAELGFTLNPAGQTLLFLDRTNQRVIDAVKLGAQESGVSVGRFPNGANTWRRLASTTPGTPNNTLRIEDVVFNELMYDPITLSAEDEYIELHNRSANSIDLSGWRISEGVGFEIPAGTQLAAGGYLVVAKNPARLLTKYPQLNAGNTVGAFSGTLANGGERLVLTKPEWFFTTNANNKISSNRVHIAVQDLTFGSGGRWGKWAGGGGSSLELMDPAADLQKAANWADSDETAKAPWTTFSYTTNLVNGSASYAADRLNFLLQGAGECLVDNVFVIPSGSTNLVRNNGFELGTTNWVLQGNHVTSTIDTNGALEGTRTLHIRSQGDGDTGVNSVRTALIRSVPAASKATITASVRWLAGWPELLARFHGNHMEMPMRMAIPENLGTPGQVNSRRLSGSAPPAISDVTHYPALPRTNQTVLVSCRVSSREPIQNLLLRYRFDTSATNPANAILTNIVMKDDGTGGDLIADDGIYSATLPSRSTASLIAFRIEASNSTAEGAPVSVFPAGAPAQECHVRWNDATPHGTFAHYHIWNTAFTDAERNRTVALNNLFRDATLVYGNARIIYNAGFRDKGSPYHSGSGDYAVTVPPDDKLMGATDRVFASTGNGDSEASGVRSRLAAWLGGEMGIPYLYAHYGYVYRNGTIHRNISEDLEQPNNNYAEAWFPSGSDGDLFKIAIWFEFSDANQGTDSATGATLESFAGPNNGYDLKRYRWNWQIRARDSASDYTNFFNLVTAINHPTEHVERMLQQVDVAEWMRVFAYHRIMGNWDSYTFNVGQNMYLYQQPGMKWNLIPWDIDFIFGLGNAANDALFSGQDPVVNAKLYNNATFRRMLWQTYIESVNDPLRPERYTPQVNALANILTKNRISGLAGTADILTYLKDRRSYIQSQIAASDTSSLSITNNGGNDFSTATPSVTLVGTAPLKVAVIEVNGIPYPVTWTGFTSFSIKVPLTTATNALTLVGKDIRGNVIANASDTITVNLTTQPQKPEDFVVINEIHYNPLEPKTSFIEIFNRSTSTPHDLSGYQIEGVGYTFPEGAIIPSGGYLLLAKDTVSFFNTYGSAIPVFGEFPGSLDNSGETLKISKPVPEGAAPVTFSEVRYSSSFPWPTNANGFGASLQLIDATRDPFRIANWSTAPLTSTNRVTPARANTGTAQTLAAFPGLWINEVYPQNITGPTDQFGGHEPAIEIINTNSASIDLSSFFLTDNETNLTQWQFPAGTILAGRSWLRIWADGESGETSAGHLHTNFRIDPTSGKVALVRFQGSPSVPAVLDYLPYNNLPADRSFGNVIDGDPRTRALFYYPTPGNTNNPAFPSVQVLINEIMAANSKTIADPADLKFSDWIELYNAGTNAVDLTGYKINDSLTNGTPFTIPSGYSIPAKGFLLVWADGDTAQNVATNSDLHVSFNLAQAGEAVALWSPDGALVDSVIFDSQSADISYGRYPDGAEATLEFMPTPTPRKTNVLTGVNRAPVITTIAPMNAPEETLISISLTGVDPDAGQSIAWSIEGDIPAGLTLNPAAALIRWTPTELQGPGTYSVTITATDNGNPPRSSSQAVSIQVTEVNRSPSLLPIPDQILTAGTGWNFDAQATDPDLPVQTISYSLQAPLPLGIVMDASSGRISWTPTSVQTGSYTLNVLATDTGVPPLSGSQSVRIQVQPRIDPVAPIIVVTLRGDGTAQLQWETQLGVSYTVEYKDDVEGADWSQLAEQIGTGSTAEYVDGPLVNSPNRFYRISAR